ncbi:putative two-component histidine kinase [Flavihumibacter petaseus NBRC 106054]|uniref:Putative two-component histidine kinase n=1 Tax=Flavihumibacter petaseus NBRC 106054 TaxID=1220578 RepID=A0A0E9MZX0_9BACT|nr:putative two-component histidine kinase [Flavihumibacter petaseus NBRC 106054]
MYHLPFWFVYHYLWWTLTIGSVWAVANNLFFTPYSIKFLFYVIFQALCVYFNLYYLIPRYLAKGRYWWYAGLLLLTMLVTAILIVPGYYVSAWLSGRDFQELYGIPPSHYSYFFQINTFPSTVASTTLGMSLKLAGNWIRSRKREQALEKEKLETELKFLKSQINPHFLFNTINSIFVLIHKNPSMASDALAKFSDLLRHQLYECNDAQIPLQQELDFLANFISLEQLRHDTHVETTITIPTDPTGSLLIAPFILLPFVENAFKHVSQDKEKSNHIRININLAEDTLYLSTSNSTSSRLLNRSSLPPSSGIGLKNVQRRLELIYPDIYKLDLQQEATDFKVSLSILLKQEKQFQKLAV